MSALRNWTSVGYIDEAMEAIFAFLCLVRAATSARNWLRAWEGYVVKIFVIRDTGSVGAQG